MPRPKKRVLRVLDRPNGLVQKWVAEMAQDDTIQSLERESEYAIDDFGCSCAGHSFKGACQHMELWRGELPESSLSEEDALLAVRIAKKCLEHEDRNVTALQGFDRDRDGRVRCIRLLTAYPPYHGRLVRWAVNLPGTTDVARLDIQGVLT